MSCSLGRYYQGDGEFVTISPWPLGNYEVHFPAFDATEEAEYLWRFRGLPEMPAVVELAIDTRNGPNCETLEASAPVRDAEIAVELLHSGARVAHMEARLEDWVWTYTLGGAGDGEWAAHNCALYFDTLFFTGERSGAYELSVKVQVPAATAPPMRASVVSYAVYLP